MIFVTLGSSTQNFNRLLKEIDDLVSQKIIKDVIVQSNSKDYVPTNYKLISNLSLDEYSKLIKSCSLLITHGGVGSILDGLKENKTIIAFSRKKEYKEAVNNHQEEIVNNFSINGYILTGEIKDLPSLIIKSQKFKPRKFKSNNEKFNFKLINEIEN